MLGEPCEQHRGGDGRSIARPAATDSALSCRIVLSRRLCCHSLFMNGMFSSAYCYGTEKWAARYGPTALGVHVRFSWAACGAESYVSIGNAAIAAGWHDLVRAPAACWQTARAPVSWSRQSTGYEGNGYMADSQSDDDQASLHRPPDSADGPDDSPGLKSRYRKGRGSQQHLLPAIFDG